jgi:WD40 repeat protein/biotin carboxyl carrier protein
MIRHIIRASLLGALVATVSACSSSSSPKIAGDKQENKARPADIGSPLFGAAPWPKGTDDPGAAEPIRILSCHLTVLDKVDVPAKEEGTMEWIGVAATPSEIATLPPSELRLHERTNIVYRRLRLGEVVNVGQVVALLNDEKAALEHEIAISNIEGAKKGREAAKKSIESFVANLKIEMDAKSSTSAIVAARANLQKAEAEEVEKGWMVIRTEGEAKKALAKLDYHAVRAPITGRVVQVYKQPGEGIKVTEPILQIQEIKRLGVEGYLEVQYADLVRVNSDVFVEPDIKEPPLRVRSPHMSSMPITAVAVGIHLGEAIIVSGSEDGWAYAWSPGGKVHGVWKHAGAVRAAACTRNGVKPSLAITGCDDGKARIWSLDAVEKTPAVTLDGHHEGGVQAAAFSPDGAACVTSDERGEIFLWNTMTGKKIYAFPREHNSTVTSLQFTPQCRVVSAGRDAAAYVWNVGDKSASVDVPFEHRSGEMNVLGVTDDGGQMLLDLDKSRLRIVDLSANRNLGTLQQTGEGGKFAAFAMFSPVIGKGNDRVILTSGGSDGVLQLWRWTNGIGRGSELRKLVSTGYAGLTCAAFSPEAKNGFVVAGTRKGVVHLWAMPVEDDLAYDLYKAKITSIDGNRESSGKTVRVYAELINPIEAKLRLHPGTTATLAVPVK